MPGFNGSGTFVRTHTWVTDKTNTVPVTASRMDAEDDGFATGLSTCLLKDGQQTATARIPFAAGLSAAAGSNTAAAFCQTNDANTGVYFPATDEVALTAGGTKTLHSTASVITIPSGVTLKANTTPYDAFPSGTAMVFAQTSAPTGWTKSTTHNDKALRVVSGTVSSGGSVAFSTCFSRTTTDNFTILQGHLPSVNLTTTISAGAGSHKHNIAGSPATFFVQAAAQNRADTVVVGTGDIATGTMDNATLPEMTGTTPLGGSGTAINPGMDIRVQYVDVTICTKD